MKRFAALLAAVLSLGAAAPSKPVALEALLAETPAPTLDAYQLFTDPGARAPNAGLTPYDLNTPLFSDYAEKSRFLFLPPGTQATYTATGAFAFPVGATLVKTFAYPADLRKPKDQVRFIETRLLIHKAEGWVALTYVWNPEQTKAVLKRAGARIAVSVIDRDGKPLTITTRSQTPTSARNATRCRANWRPLGPRRAT